MGPYDRLPASPVSGLSVPIPVVPRMVVVTTIRSVVAMSSLPCTLTLNPAQVLPPVTEPVLAKAVTPPKRSAPLPPMARAAASGAAQRRRGRPEPREPKDLCMMSPFDLTTSPHQTTLLNVSLL